MVELRVIRTHHELAMANRWVGYGMTVLAKGPVDIYRFMPADRD